MKFVFIHGYMSNPEADWYPKIREELEKLGHQVVIPPMPGHRRPNPKEWVQVVRETAERSLTSQSGESLTSPVVLVGHSLGTRAILSYLESNPNNVEKVLLISPPQGMWHNQPKISKELASKVTILHSKDDRIVAIDQGRKLAGLLGAKLIEVDGHRHFTKPEDAELVKSTLLD